MTFDGRGHSMEDDPQWKMTLDGMHPSMEDDLQWKTTLYERQPMDISLVNFQERLKKTFFL